MKTYMMVYYNSESYITLQLASARPDAAIYGTPHKKFTFRTLPMRKYVCVLTYFVLTLVRS